MDLRKTRGRLLQWNFQEDRRWEAFLPTFRGLPNLGEVSCEISSTDELSKYTAFDLLVPIHVHPTGAPHPLSASNTSQEELFHVPALLDFSVPFVAMLASFEGLISNASSAPYFRVHAWWMLIQFDGTMRSWATAGDTKGHHNYWRDRHSISDAKKKPSLLTEISSHARSSSTRAALSQVQSRSLSS